MCIKEFQQFSGLGIPYYGYGDIVGRFVLNDIMSFEEMSDPILDRNVRLFLYNKQINLQRFGIQVVFFLEDEILSVV